MSTLGSCDRDRSEEEAGPGKTLCSETVGFHLVDEGDPLLSRKVEHCESRLGRIAYGHHSEVREPHFDTRGPVVRIGVTRFPPGSSFLARFGYGNGSTSSRGTGVPSTTRRLHSSACRCRVLLKYVPARDSASVSAVHGSPLTEKSWFLSLFGMYPRSSKLHATADTAPFPGGDTS